MANERLPDDLRAVWRNQPLENPTMALEDIRRRAAGFEHRIGRRNRREFVAGGITIAIFGAYIWLLKGPLVRLGSALIIAGVALVMWRLYRSGRAEALPGDLGLTASLEFYRRQLTQQRDLLRTVLWWYLGPMIPGLLVFWSGSIPPGAFQAGHLARTLSYLLLFAAFFVWIWWINRRAAARLDRQIEELNRLEDQP